MACAPNVKKIMNLERVKTGVIFKDIFYFIYIIFIGNIMCDKYTTNYTAKFNYA